MLRIFTQFEGKSRSIDIHAVMLGDKPAYEMPLQELYDAVKKLAPHMKHEFGRQTLCFTLGCLQQIALERQGWLHDRDGNPYRPEVIKQCDTSPGEAIVGGGTLLGAK